MDFGKVELVQVGGAAGRNGSVVIRLTLVAHDDEEELEKMGVRALRLKRIMRLTREAADQGGLLGYEDLSSLLLTSLATLKRDISYLESRGSSVPLRRKRCAGRRPHDDASEKVDVESACEMHG